MEGETVKNKLKLRLKIIKNKKHTGQSFKKPVQIPLKPVSGLGLVPDIQDPGPDCVDSVLDLCRDLVQREELMMSRDRLSEEDQDQLHQDLERLWVQIRIEVHKTFSPDFSPDGLRAVILCVLDQEDLDRRWQGFPSDLVPVWRPSRTLQDHNDLLAQMVQSRLSPDQDQPDQTKNHIHPGLSTAFKQEVLRLGRRVLQDLLWVSRFVVRSYPDQLDLLNLYGGLYHSSLRLRLLKLADASLDQSDHAYLLLWTNHIFPQEILLHPELKDKLDSESLGPLLPPDVLQRLQDQHLNYIQCRVRRWLGNALQKEVDQWKTGSGSDRINGFCFSPLALDLVQVIDGALKELSCVGPDQSQDQNQNQDQSLNQDQNQNQDQSLNQDRNRDLDQIIEQIQGFLKSYLRSVEDFVKENHRNTTSVLKAQLVCEEQLRNFVLSGKMEEHQRQSCLETLTALRDCGYCSLTRDVRSQIKASLSDLWSPQWIHGSLPVLDSVLDFLSLELDHLQDLKPTCRQMVLDGLHQDVALRYVKNLLKSRRRSQEEQVGGANRIKADADKLHIFFTVQGSRPGRITQILEQVSEVLRLQDPDLVQLELGSLVRTCPDLSSRHIERLLLLKSGQSDASIRQIKRGVEESRPPQELTNQSHSFFSRIKMNWIQLKRR